MGNPRIDGFASVWRAPRRSLLPVLSQVRDGSGRIKLKSL